MKTLTQQELDILLDKWEKSDMSWEQVHKIVDKFINKADASNLNFSKRNIRYFPIIAFQISGANFSGSFIGVNNSLIVRLNSIKFSGTYTKNFFSSYPKSNFNCFKHIKSLLVLP